MKTCKDCKVLKPLSDFYKRKNGLIFTACKKCYLDRYSPNRGKPNSGRFKKGLVPWNRKMENGRQSIKAREWAAAILERDKRCVDCGATKDLHSHHIKDWNKYPKLRFDLSNGKVLCSSCHAIEHGKKMCNFLKNGEPWTKGKRLSKEHRKRLSLAHKGVPLSKSHRKSLTGRVPWNKGTKGLCSSGMKGKSHSEESKLKMSQSHKGKKLSEDHKKKLRGRVPYMNGRKHSEESKLKMSASLMGRSSWMKGRKLPDDLRMKLIKANTGRDPWNKGKKLSDEHRVKLALSWRKRKANAESYEAFRLKMGVAQKKRFKNNSAWNKGKKMSKEHCKKLSKIHKKRFKLLKEIL